MTLKVRQDRVWLLATAEAVAEILKMRSEGTRLRIRIPKQASTTNTDGWHVVIGDLGKNQPRLEIWLDRFSGYPERKLYAGYCAKAHPQIIAITKRVSKKLWPARVVTSEDTSKDKYLVLTERLERAEFNTPILEKYRRGWAFYGIFDPTRETAERLNPNFCNRAAAFFEDVAHALPRARNLDEQHEVYPRYENRKRVISHLQRERSRYLATERKILDKYKCQVCGMRFEHKYGTVGRDFAEAHHLIPLSQLRSNVQTSLEDLRTVCANCHRMLHRMDGKRDDVKKLRSIVRSRGGKRA
jgi:5-methylcytosine-specific restriction endonuclease McrA